jgi:gamma-glutamyltranspeptidase/glutathione hydrolase
MQANSVEPFYRGDIAQRIADGYRKNGGIVTTKDLAAYRARIVEPLQLRWGDHTLFTGPITNGGITTLQILTTLQALDWTRLPAGIERTHAQVEAMRLAWRDRLTLLGDPDFVSDPTKKLLSKSYAQECADRVRSVVKSGKTLAHAVTARDHGGTLSFSAVDRHGNLAALTLTHGNGFGARVTVDDLGLTLGHGMSRFDPDPQHPNAPAPGKRPLHNMAPFIVTRRGRPVVAIGGRGGRKIPNSMLEFLLQFVALGQPFTEAMKAPRLNTEGDLVLEHEKAWPANEIPLLAKLGYRPKVGTPATLSGVIREADSFSKAMR